MFKMIVFDLDGTLTPSRSSMEPDMVILFKELLKKYKVGVVSGGDFGQFQKQFISHLGEDEELLKNLYLCPTCSTKMYIFKAGAWNKLYSLNLEDIEISFITSVLKKAIIDLNLKPEKIYGDIIENRETQITFAVLGVDAPTEIKKIWDPDFKKRIQIRDYIKDTLKDYNVLVAGSTSIDITKSGIDKAYGIKKLAEVSNMDTQEMIFVGDALFPGGNDYPPFEAGIVSKRVYNTNDTKDFIKVLIN